MLLSIGCTADNACGGDVIDGDDDIITANAQRFSTNEQRSNNSRPDAPRTSGAGDGGELLLEPGTDAATLVDAVRCVANCSESAASNATNDARREVSTATAATLRRVDADWPQSAPASPDSSAQSRRSC